MNSSNADVVSSLDGIASAIRARVAPAVDANGWTVYDHGSYRIYFKRITFTSNSVGTGATPFNVSSTTLPVDVTSIAVGSLQYSVVATAFAGDLTVTFEGTSNRTNLNFTASSKVSRSYNGHIDVVITTA